MMFMTDADFTAGARSTKSSIHKIQSGKNYGVNIGQGNLKVAYSAEGKMTHYINGSKKVSH